MYSCTRMYMRRVYINRVIILYHYYLVSEMTYNVLMAQYNSSVESNQNVKSKQQRVVSKIGK